MNPPDLNALRQGDRDAWDKVFVWLWPVAFSVAQLKIGHVLPEDVEDVAIEALEELVEKVAMVQKVEELKALLASIAHHRAISRLREHFAQKRGSGQVESLEAKQEDGGDFPEAIAPGSLVASLEQNELAERLRRVIASLKPPCREMLPDFYVSELGYDQIAKKYGLAMGSVGVYLKRCLEALRRLWGGKAE